MITRHLFFHQDSQDGQDVHIRLHCLHIHIMCVFGPYYTCPKPLLTFGHNPSSLPKCCFQHCDDGSKKTFPRLGLSRFKSCTHSRNFSPVQITSAALQRVAEQHSRSNSLSMFELFMTRQVHFNFYKGQALPHLSHF